MKPTAACTMTRQSLCTVCARRFLSTSIVRDSRLYSLGPGDLPSWMTSFALIRAARAAPGKVPAEATSHVFVKCSCSHQNGLRNYLATVFKLQNNSL